MADLTDIQAAGSTKIVGSDSTGLETNPLVVTSIGQATVSDGLSGGSAVYGNLSVPTANTAVEIKVGGSALTNRKSVTFFALDADFYWGYSNSVTTSNGTQLFKGQLITWSLNPAATTGLTIFVVCTSSSKNGRITECT